MGDLCEQLEACETRCVVGNRMFNHLMYADDLVTLYSSFSQSAVDMACKKTSECRHDRKSSRKEITLYNFLLSLFPVKK